MILRVDGRTYRGRAVAVHGLDPGRVAAAVAGGDRTAGTDDPASPDARGGDPTGRARADPTERGRRDARGDGAGEGRDRDRQFGPAVRVEAPPPGPLHDRAGLLAPDRSVAVRATVAAAARTLGHEAPQDGDVEAVRSELRSIEVGSESDDREAALRRVADLEGEEERLAERVARLQGRVQTLRDREEDADDARERLREAAARLSEVRTERLAARQRLDRIERDLRSVRDRQERRLELEDRLGNLRRAARRHLARAVWDRFRAAVDSVPGRATVGDRPGTFEGEDLVAAMAAVRIADLAAPVVVACDRFRSPAAAADRLGAPVVRVHLAG